jgi:hypothetical protein
MASDILLYRSVSLDPGRSELHRNGRWFAPLPERTVGPDQSLNIYFELYNLSRHQSLSEYEVSYFIFAYPEEKQPGLWTWFSKGITWLLGVETDQDPFVVQTVLRTTREQPAAETMRINIDALDEGRYLLKVNVLDKYVGARAEAATVFVRRLEQ